MSLSVTIEENPGGSRYAPVQVGSGGCRLGGRVWTGGGLIRFVLPAPAVDIHGNEAQVEEKGGHELSIKPVRNQWQAINLRSVALKSTNRLTA